MDRMKNRCIQGIGNRRNCLQCVDLAILFCIYPNNVDAQSNRVFRQVLQEQTRHVGLSVRCAFIKPSFVACE